MEQRKKWLDNYGTSGKDLRLQKMEGSIAYSCTIVGCSALCHSFQDYGSDIQDKISAAKHLLKVRLSAVQFASNKFQRSRSLSYDCGSVTKHMRQWHRHHNWGAFIGMAQ